jgi:hypothetical protein
MFAPVVIPAGTVYPALFIFSFSMDVILTPFLRIYLHEVPKTGAAVLELPVIPGGGCLAMPGVRIPGHGLNIGNQTIV